MILTGGRLTPAMQACLRAEFNTQERSSTAQAAGFSLLLLLIPLLVVLWTGWQPWMIALLVFAALVALPLVTVPWRQRRAVPEAIPGEYRRYEGLIDANFVDRVDDEGDKSRNYFLRLATLEERRAGKDGITVPLDGARGEELNELFRQAVQGVALYEEDADVVFAIWAEDGSLLYHHPDYAAEDDADIALPASADDTGIADGAPIGDDPATMRVQ